ncbi:MAG: cytochrome c oxidase subunit 3 [Gammaproteobacteria bacterium]|nr:MAG: cytochrome c oxidase subunit 3 [Gammaproteobacteria bacterium]
MSAKGSYYLPEPSPWPIIVSSGLFSLALGFVLKLNGVGIGLWLMLLGAALVIFVVARWFGQVIAESEAGTYNIQVDRSFRWSMGWFIFSEVMFFAAFFGALFYVRQFSVTWLGDAEWIWPGYDAVWPTAGPGGQTAIAAGTAPSGPDQFAPMGAWGIPFINTLILLSSGVTVTWAHWGMKKNNRAQLVTGLFLTVVLGITFLSLQAYEYVHAWNELNLTLKSGAYGSTFYLLTGFHGFHVTLGTIMLIVILGRSIMGHFTADRHFGFEGVAWYWHFVDVVWLFLFIFVYML